MAFDDRLQYLLLGLGIGFVLGYLVRLIQDIKQAVKEVKSDVHDVKEELDEVDEIVKHELGTHDRNEGGFMRNPLIADIAILLVVVLTAYAAFVSQSASNDVIKSQERNEAVVKCNQAVLADVIETLNERSTYTTEMASANIDLQQAQAEFFGLLLHKPPYSEERRSRAALAYYDNLQAFLDVAQKNRSKVVTNPYPTVDDFSECLRND